MNAGEVTWRSRKAVGARAPDDRARREKAACSAIAVNASGQRQQMIVVTSACADLNYALTFPLAKQLVPAKQGLAGVERCEVLFYALAESEKRQDGDDDDD